MISTIMASIYIFLLVENISINIANYFSSIGNLVDRKFQKNAYGSDF